MRFVILLSLLFASAFQTALGEQDGDWTYSVSNGQATIISYTGAGGAVTIPGEVNGIPVVQVGAGDGSVVFGFGYGGGPAPRVYVTSLIIPDSVTSIEENALRGLINLTSFTMPDRFIGQVAQIGIGGQVATDYLVNALANNDAFVTAVANKIKATGGNYGIATQSGLSSAITTAVEPLATKAELTSSLTQSRTDGINSVLSNPNLWTLYTTSQIQNMAVGDLVLTRQVSGGFVLNYDIEQSTDLQTWTTYAPLSLPLTGLPTDKAFVRIKAKQ